MSFFYYLLALHTRYSDIQDLQYAQNDQQITQKINQRNNFNSMGNKIKKYKVSECPLMKNKCLLCVFNLVKLKNETEG